MPLLQPTSNSHLRRKTTEISPHPALPRPVTGVSAGRAVPGLPAHPSSQLSSIQEAISSTATLGKPPAFHQKNLMKNQRVPHRMFRFLQNWHFPTILSGSFSPAQSTVSVPRASACRDTWSSAAGSKEAAARSIYFSPPCRASLQSICEIASPPHAHFDAVLTASVESSAGAAREGKAPKLKGSITHMFLAPSLTLPPPLKLLAFTQLSVLGILPKKVQFLCNTSPFFWAWGDQRSIT